MPEGHVVHADARRFASTLGGRRVRACSPQGRFASGAAMLDGRVLCDAQAYGKNLFLRFSPGVSSSGVSPADAVTPYLHVHLGLIGAWTWWDATGAQLAGKPIARADSAVRLRLSAAEPGGPAAELRGTMVCSILDEQQADAVVAALGPDPIRDDGPAAADAAWSRIRRSRTPIGTLLDQTVVAGAGLIWRCEAPFLAGISPFRPGHDLSSPEWALLWGELSRLMRAAVSQVEPFHVFRRAGEPCHRCGTPVAEAPLAGRKVWWCPHDQPR